MSDVFIVGFEEAESSRRALDFAAERAKRCNGEVHLVSVLEWSPYSFHTPEELNERHKRREEELDRANGLLQPLVEELKAAGVKASSEARHGHAGDILSTIAVEKGAAQIIIGRTGSSAFTARLLGGLAITLAQASPVPVTIVP